MSSFLGNPPTDFSVENPMSDEVAGVHLYGGKDQLQMSKEEENYLRIEALYKNHRTLVYIRKSGMIT